MKWILPMNQPFKNLKEFASVHGENLPLVAHSSRSKVELKSTQDDSVLESGAAQFHRFQKSGDKKWQTSFQKNFLAQHTTAFRRQLWNFLEYGPAQLSPQNSKLPPALKADLLLPGQPPTVTALLAKEQIRASPHHLHQFCQSLHKLEDLEGFLNSVLKECNEELAAELVTLCLELWIQFRSEELLRSERKELLQKAREWVTLHAAQLLQRDDFTYINWKLAAQENEDKSGIPKPFIHFLSCLVTTVLFILGGFFQNPYAEAKFDLDSETMASYPKRQLSLSQESYWSNQSDYSDNEESFQPKKQRKLS